MVKGKRRHGLRRVISDVNDSTEATRADVVMAEQCPGARIDKRRFGAAVPQEICDKLRRRKRIDEHGHKAGANGAENRRCVFGTVIEQHQHAPAARKPHFREAVADAIGERAQLAIGKAAVSANQRDLVGTRRKIVI